MQSLAQKLLLKPGCRAALMNAPEGYAERLGPLPEGVVLTSERESGLDFVQLFVHDRADLEQRLPTAVAALKPAGLLWVCYPKGGQKAGTDLHRDILWGLLNERDLTGVTLVAVDDVWSAMRARPAEQVRSIRTDETPTPSSETAQGRRPEPRNRMIGSKTGVGA